VVANSASNTLSVFLGNGAGQFAAGVAYGAGSGPVSVTSGDFNSDGLQDLAVANSGDGTIWVLLGLGNGTFQTGISFTVGAGPDSIITGDFNKDSLADLLTANFTGGNFSILIGAGTGSFHDQNGTNIPGTGGQSFAPPPSFNFEDLGLSVKATPHIHGTDEVSLTIEAAVKQLNGLAGNGLPIIGQRTLAAEVRLRNGEWAMLAGLMTTTDALSISGTPGLSSLPVVGPLTRVKTKTKDNTEVLVLLKTNLLRAPGEGDSRPIWMGTETHPRSPF